MDPDMLNCMKGRKVYVHSDLNPALHPVEKNSYESTVLMCHVFSSIDLKQSSNVRLSQPLPIPKQFLPRKDSSAISPNL